MTRKNYFYCTLQLTGIAFDCFRLQLDFGSLNLPMSQWKLADADTKSVMASEMHSVASVDVGRIEATAQTNKTRNKTTWEVSLCARCYSQPVLALWRHSAQAPPMPTTN
jgi:hypothetical protein